MSTLVVVRVFRSSNDLLKTTLGVFKGFDGEPRHALDVVVLGIDKSSKICEKKEEKNTWLETIVGG